MSGLPGIPVGPGIWNAPGQGQTPHGVIIVVVVVIVFLYVLFGAFTAFRWMLYNKARKTTLMDDPSPPVPLASEYHWGFSVIVSATALVAHALFTVGQSQIVWNTAAEAKFSDIHVNGTVPVLLKQVDFKITKLAPNAAELQNHSYFDLVDLLWTLEDGQVNYDGSPKTKEKYLVRFGAILLVLFSGVWPHVKLMLLQLFWYNPISAKRRTTAFFWLDLFGKWSMFDVLVVALLVATFELSLDTDLATLISHFEDGLPYIVDTYMKNETDWKTGLCFFTTVLDNQTQAPAIRNVCENLIDFFFCPLNMDTFDFKCPNGTEAKCGDECKKLIGLLKNGDPDDFPPYGPLNFSGHMYLSFRALSQIGIYCFAAGVFISLISSFALNIVDAKWSRSHTKQLQRRAELEDCNTDKEPPTEPQNSFALLLADRAEARVWPKWWKLLLCLLITVVSTTVYFIGVTQAVSWRKTGGVWPTVLDPLLYNDTSGETKNPLNKWYSLWDVLILIGSGGGADMFLAFIWLLFVIVGPGLLVISMLLTAFVPMTPNMQYWALLVTQLLTSFAAWEVVGAAFLIMTLEYPSLSDYACGGTGLNETPVRIISDDFHFGGVPGACVEIDFLETGLWCLLPVGFIFMFFWKHLAHPLRSGAHPALQHLLRWTLQRPRVPTSDGMMVHFMYARYHFISHTFVAHRLHTTRIYIV